MIVGGWTLLCHDALVGQLTRLIAASERARKSDPRNYRSNGHVKLLAGLTKLMLQTIPADPARPEYRQGNTLGPKHRHWFRAKLFSRFRLFFRYDSVARIVVYAWVNDERTLRQRGGRSDPYEVFRRMLAAGNPPDDWDTLVAASRDPPEGFMVLGDT